MQVWQESDTLRVFVLVIPVTIKSLTVLQSGHLIEDNHVDVFIPGMKLTLSALVDGKNINAGGHKLGLGLELEA